ncbi:MAG: hypothetical protein ABL959_11615, partial [Pyrinomonadaceae bacterium]
MKIGFPSRFLLILALVIAAFIPSHAQTAEQLKRASELFKRGTENYKNNRDDAAIADFTEYLKIRPTVAAAWFNRGIA